jgi:hypothetical protein
MKRFTNRIARVTFSRQRRQQLFGGTLMSQRMRPRSATRSAALLGAALALSLSGAATAASGVAQGFLLTGTDAAYARFVAPVDECHGLDLFVGYVQADRLVSPLGDGRPHFHSDIEAQLSVSENSETEACGTDVLHLAGVRGLTDGDQVQIVTLEMATLDGFALTLRGIEDDDPVTVVLTLDLAWTVSGGVFSETTHAPGSHSAHRTVAAAIDGTISIDSVSGGGESAAALSTLVGQAVGGLDQTEGSITHYQEISIAVP